ncbi:MAG TPA: bifunctional DNA-formamidopyrimidine glycosylase/DNA-(apurinic or apyrimidinic site) lyase [Planctomicrobium sp.]|nr:bifunctional DNA-formamidopyrimidine glycosylase/DNA-(apurinic or apyrimidinic site) lyase [Planctomicrobium sp.]
MPELPEVETMVRGIQSTFVGSRIIDVRLPECFCRPILMEPDFQKIQQLSLRKRVTNVTRRAKRIVIHLEEGSAFVVEPRMTGLLLVSDPPDQSHLRFEWKVSQGRKRHSIWFWDRRGLGTLKLFTPIQLDELLSHSYLGPDALKLTMDDLHERLRRTDRPIKVALLDQKLIAGIGNLYASEILHQAGIHPTTPASRLRTPRLTRLLAATLAILEEAILYEGSTLGDGTYRNALNQDGNYQNKHRVYAREGDTCRTCEAATIRRIVQAQRSTFFCPHCQK